MRRNPLALLAALASLVIYLLVREVGHFLAIAVLGFPIFLFLRFGFLPTAEVGQGILSLPVTSAAWIIAAGPIATLALGYALIILIGRRRLRGAIFALLVGAITCYLALMLDPIYYTVIPLFNLGGEPETLGYLLGISSARIEIGALALLAANILLTRRIVVPFLRALSREEPEA